MGWQRTASVALVSATAAALATSAFWLWRGTDGFRHEVPNDGTVSLSSEPDLPVQRAPGAPLAVPVTGVRPDQLTDTFTQARAGGQRRHDAIDIMAPAGTPVVAAASGTLERLFTSRAGGLTVYIRSPDHGIETYYAHLRDYAPGLREGQAIRVGQRLGSVGSTGNASPDGPHLHFAVARVAPGESWYGGQAINPYPLLTARR